jgi:hypothetical protein
METMQAGNKRRQLQHKEHVGRKQKQADTAKRACSMKQLYHEENVGRKQKLTNTA